MIIFYGMLRFYSLGFVGEGMAFMGKNGEVPLQSLMIISFFFILPLSSSTFSTEIISFESQIDSLIPFLYTDLHRKQFYMLVPAEYSQGSHVSATIFLPSAWQPRKSFSFLFPFTNYLSFQPRLAHACATHSSQPLDYIKFLNVCAVVLGSSSPMIFNSLA